MANCIVIGGGLAGLSSCIYLSNSGHKITLLDSSPKLGGRTYSFFDKTTSSEIDNGQHILMGAYKETFKFLKIIGTDNIPEYQSNLRVEFVKRGGKKFFLVAPNIFYPFNLLIALFRFNALSFREKISVIRFLSSLLFDASEFTEKLTLTDWLTKKRQSENTIKSLWEVIAVGALNSSLDQCSVEAFKNLIKKIFFYGNQSSTMVLPSAPLNKLFIEPSIKYFQKNNIEYSLSEKVQSILSENGKIVKIRTNKREIENFDFIILAVPSYSIGQIQCNEELISNDLIQMETSPIVTVHLWINESLIKSNFIGLIDSSLHWIFSNKNHLSIVISAADNIINRENLDIIKLVMKEIKDFFPHFNLKNIETFKVLKEKRATLKSTIYNENLRHSIVSNFSNLILAGDWTNTGLPCTIEGAILSGKSAAQKII